MLSYPLSAAGEERVDNPPAGGVVGVSQLCAKHLRQHRFDSLLTRSFPPTGGSTTLSPASLKEGKSHAYFFNLTNSIGDKDR
jgi:hypothetical protein